jgi:hypothetical protein
MSRKLPHIRRCDELQIRHRHDQGRYPRQPQRAVRTHRKLSFASPFHRRFYALTYTQLQLYESNTAPHTYAVNLQFAGTDQAMKNNILAAIGTTFATAFRVFKDAFKDKTGGVEWDDRILFALERAAQEKRDRGRGTGSDTQSRVGIPVADEVVAETARKILNQKVDFKDMPFEYHPPRYGPRGNLPMGKDGTKDGGRPSDEKVQTWMSGGNGAGPQTQGDQHTATANGLTANGDFDFSFNGSAQEDTTTNTNFGAPDEFDKHVDEAFEGTYPFDPVDSETVIDNPEFEKFMKPDPPNANTESGNAAAQPVSETHMDTSFDTNQQQSSETFDKATQANATQHTSFNQPPSTVVESFQQGTQEIGETQIAQRAAGELQEYMAHPQDSQEAEGAIPPKPLDLGKSVLGKRKAANDGVEDVTTESPSADGPANGDMNVDKAKVEDEAEKKIKLEKDHGKEDGDDANAENEIKLAGETDDLFDEFAKGEDETDRVDEGVAMDVEGEDEAAAST